MLIRFDPFSEERAVVVERPVSEWDMFDVFEVNGATFERYERALDELDEATEVLRAAREAHIEWLQKLRPYGAQEEGK